MTHVLFDSSWLAHRAKHAIGLNLSYKDEPTSVIFGFFQQLQSICFDKRVQSNRVAIFFDSPRSFRQEAHSFYKANRGARNKTTEELIEREVMHDQLNKLHTDILPQCGFPCYSQVGLESDDLIASACLELDGLGVIITADMDLLQCISDKAHWFDPAKGMNGTYLDTAGMIQLKKVGPNDWAYIKSIAGCTSDNVPGIDGVGEKTAIDYLWKLAKPGKRLEAIESDEGQKIIARNMKLIKLPHKLTKQVQIVTPKYKPDVFFSWCKKLGFRSYLEGPQRKSWDQFFSGHMSPLDRQVPRKRIVKQGDNQPTLFGD